MLFGEQTYSALGIKGTTRSYTMHVNLSNDQNVLLVRIILIQLSLRNAAV